MLQGIDHGVDILTEKTISLKREITIPPMTPMIITCEKP
jgi:hypothetical protein